MQKELHVKKDYASVGEEIGHELAVNFVEDFQNAHPEEATSFAIGRNIIDQILAQPGCIGMRFYNALNENGQKTTVYLGIDADGKNIVKKVVVEETGSITTVPAIVADRIEWDELVRLIFPF